MRLPVELKAGRMIESVLDTFEAQMVRLREVKS